MECEYIIDLYDLDKYNLSRPLSISGITYGRDGSEVYSWSVTNLE